MKRGFVSKRAQVGIIVVVLLILIVLVAFVIVWNVVGGLVSERSEDIEVGLLTVELEVKDVVFFVTGSSKISVERKVGRGDVDGLKIVFYDEEGNSEVKTVSAGLGELETKDFSFDPVEIGKVERVSVYPVYRDNIGREFKSEVSRVIEMPEGLVSWWRFDGIEDYVGGNDGSLVGSVIDNGKLVVGNGYFEVNDGNSLDLDEGVSVSVWVLGSGDGVIVGKGGNYKVFLRGGKVVFSYSGNEFESYEEIEEGWNHVAVSADFDGVFKMFVNGGAVSDFVNLEGGVVVNNDDLKIGDGFVGEIDEVMVFDRALSVEQVRGLYGFGRE